MTRKLLVMVLVGTIAWPLAAGASDLDERWGIGIEAGFMKLVWGERDYSNVDEFAGVRLRHGLSSHWTLDLAFKYGYIRPGVEKRGEKAGFTTKSGQGFYTTMLHPTAAALYRFTPENKFQFYVGGAVGVLGWKVRDHRGDENVGWFPNGPTLLGYDTQEREQRLKGSNVTLSIMAAAEWFISEKFALDFGLRYHQLLANDVDNVGMSTDETPPGWGAAHVDANTARVEAFLGLSVYFGSADSDGDGIPNSRDACPDEAEDVDGNLDEDGCPDTDNDGDGVLDAEDACPDEAEDVDGFQDEDGCPDPDNDGDGIVDAQDACPDEAEDIDGFQDEDGCPDPDNDGDGVLDAQDTCPDTPSGVAVDAEGCPVVAPVVASLVLEGVSFESGKAILTAGSLAILDDIAERLQARPEVRVEIGGHTDSTGSAETNLTLSQRRAEAVREYLVGEGIAPGRLVARGYGEDQPIASNETRDGRSQNRRVELKRID